MNGLVDTNIAVYVLNGNLVVPLPVGHYGVSVVTEMELLAWPSLMMQEEIQVRTFLQPAPSANSRPPSASRRCGCGARSV